MMMARAAVMALCVAAAFPTASAFLAPLRIPSLTSRVSASAKIARRRPMEPPVHHAAPRVGNRIGGGLLGLRASSSDGIVGDGAGEHVLVARKTLIDGEMRPALVAVKVRSQGHAL